MTEYKCENCKEIHNISPKSKFCPTCGSTSLTLLVKEQAEPAAKETIGVYTPPIDFVSVTDELEEEDRPSQRSKP